MKESTLVAWNGLQMHIPAEWDVHVGGPRHLVFEKDFQPQAQIRWEKENRQLPPHNDSRLAKIISQMGSILPELPSEWHRLTGKFCDVTAYRQTDGELEGVYCVCPQCNIIILVQLLTNNEKVREPIANCLATLSCQPSDQVLWRIQDFSLITPSFFTLSDYSFGAGLTRLSFCRADPFLHTCRIATADDRLRHQSLEELLSTLTGTGELKITSSDDNICQGIRTPSIIRQLLFRLRREKPFLWSRIWHDKTNNRLLAVILTSSYPIPEETACSICAHYEVVS